MHRGACGILALALSILAAPLAAEAQLPRKLPRVGYLLVPPLAERPSTERLAFLQGLRELGYDEGQNIAIEYRSAAWNRELLPDLAAELVELKVDVIVAPGLQAALAGPERHLRDIAGMLRVSSAEIDTRYIDDWARQLGVSDVWQVVRQREETR